MKQTIWSILRVFVILFLATLLSFAFEQMDLRRENIMLIYVIASLLIMIETKRFLFGLAATIMLVFVFNFFFTEPKYTFIIDDPNYIITMAIFIVVSFVVSTLTSKLHKEVITSRQNQKRVEQLYQMSKILLNASTISDILLKEMAFLEGIFENKTAVVLVRSKKEEFYSNHTDIDLLPYKKAIEHAISFQELCGYETHQFQELPVLLFPMKGKEQFKGVLMMDLEKKKLTAQEQEFVETNVIHMAVAIEKEIYAQEEENARVAMEREKFKSALLRSLSHDLRTPLTSIQTGSSILLDSQTKLDEETKRSMLLDMNNETSRLSEFVDNLLNMTKIHSEKLNVNKRLELVDDIFADVYHRVYRRLGSATLEMQSPEDQTEMVSVYCDATLLIQILTNLIDNAVMHTKDNTHITLSYQQRPLDVLFSVKDDGGGIDQENLEKIFQDFVSVGYKKQDQNRGMGLGLSISRSLVEAHGGIIRAENNEIGGATFTFTIPNLKKETKHESN